jgi:putative oxidoreductase
MVMEALRRNIGLLVLRIGFGGTMMFSHGLAKLMNFGQMSESFPDPLGVGPVFSLGLCILAEFFCALLITIGFYTRWATYPLMINMMVAALLIHKNDPFQKKELALIYLMGFIAINLLGAGRYSLGKKDRN